MQNLALFVEKQKFTQWWIYLMVIIFDIIFIISLVSLIYAGMQTEFDITTLVIMIIMTLILLGFSSLFFVIRLETEIRSDGIYVRYFPLQTNFRQFLWSDISKCYIREYSPMMEYGGYGIRGFRNNRALNVSGKIGLQLIFNDNRTMLVGTKKPDEMASVLRSMNKYKE